MPATATAEMPFPQTYNEAIKFWPFNISLEKTLELIAELVPKNGTLVDAMCGSGYLLGKISERRPDIVLIGVELDPKYVQFCNKKYPKIFVTKGDVLDWNLAGEKADMVTCTGALHHVPYPQQDPAVGNMASMVKPGGLAIISDVYIGDYSGEEERRQRATALGDAYVEYARAKGAPGNVMRWTEDIRSNDLAMTEYKTSLRKRLPVLKKHFPGGIEHTKTWPEHPAAYSERIHLCRVP